jgi:murein DD-endopeptidase MepM/ murein hydrolase activator NlpD
MGPGEVYEVDSATWFYIRVAMDAGYYINYVHIETTTLKIGDRVEGNYRTVIGMYGKVGRTSYPHLHIQFEDPLYNSVDPAPYWPGGAPTQWRWGNPT